MMRYLAVFALAAAIPMASRADDFSFTGNFTHDNDVQAFTFTVGATSTVTLVTYSYAGGTNAAGQTIDRGGFDPILALFSGTGPSAVYIGQDDDGGSNVPADPMTGEHYDTWLQEVDLPAGTYTVTVMQYANFSYGTTLGAGFYEDGSGNEDFTAAYGCSQGFFCDVSGAAPYNNRDGDWAFDILGVNGATQVPPGATPEPSSIALLGTALLGAAGALRRRLAR